MNTFRANLDRQVRGILADTYTPDGISMWLLSPNRNLDGRCPIDMLTPGGDWQRVLAEARRVGSEG